jgi:hypothetical protein
MSNKEIPHGDIEDIPYAKSKPLPSEKHRKAKSK